MGIDGNQTEQALVLRIGPEELVVRRRYEAASIANDILIGIWFLIGSFLFFSPATMTAGTVLFVLGSIEMLIRPTIRMARHIHLQRFRRPGGTDPATADDAVTESERDF
ncbi:hypothetical protein GOHSU_41_00220 [Gordonia hirsuta DSM 44140 = NBRC 16056]|uniref:YrhK domain-containing protein n=1 Tax=Gordonia hirsuta DSM 44140 = NBRC 16056 TaxID=1121927 RepID=L7LBJ9_9ACTN|nr:hypothetical protein GOHSU_41_00220 [Gordonia hirsuta DSM 44140 = NBRC 16056]